MVSVQICTPQMLPSGVKFLVTLLQTAVQLIVTLSPPLAASITCLAPPDSVTRTMLWTCDRRPLLAMLGVCLVKIGVSSRLKVVKGFLTGSMRRLMLSVCVRCVVLVPDRLVAQCDGTTIVTM